MANPSFSSHSPLRNDLLLLLHNLFDPLLNHLLLLLLPTPPLTRPDAQPFPLSLQALPCLRLPRVPLVDQPPPQLQHLGGTLRLGRGVFLVELARELSEALSDLLLVVLWEEGRGAGSPEELLESVDVVTFELLAAEVPDGVAGVGLRVWR
jgi:hypothetical protein